jgi:hypothetical protein
MPRISVFFFNAQGNLRRFLFSLADSGVLMPYANKELRGQYKLFEKPSFIPTGHISTSYPRQPDLIREVFRAIASRVKEITERNPAAYPPFTSAAVSLLHGHFLGKANSFLTSHSSERISRLRYSQETAIRALFNRISPGNRFARHWARLKKGSSTGFGQEIEMEFASLKWKEKIWTSRLKSLCLSVAKSGKLAGRVYLPGNLEIVRQLVLLVHGSSGLQSDGTEVPVIEATLSEVVFESYMLFTEPFFSSHDEGDIEGVTRRFYEMVVNLLGSPSGILCAHFRQHGILLDFLKRDFGDLFARRFKKFWHLWNWMMFERNDHLKALASFAASVLMLVLPRAVELNLVTSGDFSSRWSELTSGVKLGVVMNTANWLLYMDEREDKTELF